MQHAAVELFRGTMTRHNLIAYRDDYPGESQPIRFDGDCWRDYIPIRLPWTICIRERVPPGSVAVLINRASMLTRNDSSMQSTGSEPLTKFYRFIQRNAFGGEPLNSSSGYGSTTRSCSMHRNKKVHGY